MHHPKRWGHLQDRYQESRPRKMLALDGGGIRGLLTLGILERMEKLLAERQGSDNLLRVGRAAAAQLSLDHFGSFV